MISYWDSDSDWDRQIAQRLEGLAKFRSWPCRALWI